MDEKMRMNSHTEEEESFLDESIRYNTLQCTKKRKMQDTMLIIE